MVFGKQSYLVHYMAQCVLAGRIPKALANEKDSFHYSPVHSDDIAKAVEEGFGKIQELKGQVYSLNGSKELKLSEMLKILEDTNNKQNTKKYRPFLGIGLTDFVEEFFVGITHDKNMVRMAKFFEQNPYLASSLKENDILAKVGANNGVGFGEFFK